MTNISPLAILGFVALAAVMIATWSVFASSIAHIELVSDTEVRLRNKFGKVFRIPTARIRKLEHWLGYKHRLMLKTQPTGFFSLAPHTFWIPLSDSRPQELEAAKALMDWFPTSTIHQNDPPQ